MKRLEFILSLAGCLCGTGLVIHDAMKADWFMVVVWLALLAINMVSAWKTWPKAVQCECVMFQRVGWCGDRVILDRHQDATEPMKTMVLFSETAKLQCVRCGRVRLRKMNDIAVEWAERPADWQPDESEGE